MIGFAKLIGELIDGLLKVMLFFGGAALIATAIIYAYTRCIRSTALVIACSLVAVVWQLGLVALFGFELDPFSILVPFLVFAIGVSHGAQKMNGIMQDIGRGTIKQVAARYTFRRLFLAGVTALLADAVGFAVLMVIDIPVIKDLALTASIGVAVLIFTNLLLLPVLLSYTGVSARAAEHSLKEEKEETKGKGLGKLWVVARSLHHPAVGAGCDRRLGGAGGGRPRGQHASQDRRPRPRRARAAARLALQPRQCLHHRRTTRSLSDQFAVIVKTDKEGCLKYPTLVEADRMAWALKQIPGVQTTVSLVDTARQITAGSFEGSPKWLTINRNQDVLNYAAQQASVNNPDLFNTDCSVMPVIAYLADHKADTLQRVVDAAADFADKHSDKDRQFLLAAGSAGIEAATNIVVKKANTHDAALRLPGGDRAVLHHLPQLARRDRGGGAADDHLDPVRGADGGAGHRRQGRDAAGDRARRGHRRRLRAVPAVGAARAAAQGSAARRRRTRRPCSSPARSSPSSASRSPPASSPGPGRRSSSRPTWASCSPSCSYGI